MMINDEKKTFKKVVKKLLKILLLLTLGIGALLVYINYELSTDRSCYDISLDEGSKIIERVIESRIKDGKDEVYDIDLKNRLLVSYTKIVVDKEKKISFLDLQYIDEVTRQEFSVVIHEDCTIQWIDGHSNAYEKNTIIP